MSDCLVFNHHSLPFSTRQSAEKAVPNFLKICIEAHNAGLSTILVDETQDANWFRIELAKNYYWNNWYDVAKRDPLMRDSMRAFLSINTRTPLFKKEDVGGDLELFDVREKISKTAYVALRAAAWYSAPLISFSTRIPWNENPVKILVERFEDDVLSRESNQLLNIYSFEVWDAIRPNFVAQRNKRITRGRDLWHERSNLYPFLEFCGKAPAQIQDWAHQPSIFKQMKESLNALNSFSKKWLGELVPDYSHNRIKGEGLNHRVSGESSSVNNDPRKREKRMFYLPDGRKEYFENHVKLAQGFRLHFYPDSNSKKIYVAYIGPHLLL